MKKLYISFCLLMATSWLVAQVQYTFDYSLPVVVNGDTLNNAWAGGLNAPQLSEIDLDNDGIKDLFIFDREGNTMRTYINQGTPGQVDYIYAPEWRKKFPQDMRDFALLADFDCDGREDIFTVTVGGMKVYHNDYDIAGDLSFSEYMPLLMTFYFSNWVNMIIAPMDIPAFTDVDNDGDMDILMFGGPGGPTANTIEYHRNMSMEYWGRCDTIDFTRETGCWANFFESILTCDLSHWECGFFQDPDTTIFQRIKEHEKEIQSSPIHEGSAIVAMDIDQDSVTDLVIGDVGCTKLILLENVGTIDTADVAWTAPNIVLSQDTLFPSNHSSTIATDLFIFPAPYYLDVNNDGVKDLIAAANTTADAENFTSVWRYTNDSLTDLPDFNYVQNDFLQDEMIEVGTGAAPVFFDADSDGLMDLIVGNYGYFDRPNVDYDGQLAYFKNTGTVNNPVFELQTRDYENLSSLNLIGLYPTFGDIDNDGDEDMIVGDEGGYVHLFQNTGGSGPASFGLLEFQMDSIDVGDQAVPQLIDVDRDGDLDLVLGERNGELTYYENSGDSANKFFSSSPTYNLFGGIDVKSQCCTGYSAPFMAESADSSGYLLYVGTERGVILIYDGIEGNIGGNFTLVDSIVTREFRVNVHGADITSSDTIELVYGTFPGGVGLMFGSNIPLAARSLATTALNFVVFPNPATDALNIHLSNIPDAPVQLQVWDIVGKKVFQETFTNNYFTVGLSGLSNGVYTIHLQTEGAIGTRKFVKQ